jgi:hypothetical protein
LNVLLTSFFFWKYFILTYMLLIDFAD